jgi:hypothetical protein
LKPEDAAKAKSLYAQKAEIEKEIVKLEGTMRERYLRETLDAKGQYLFTTTKAGWESGFQYSTDFKFIVPKGYQQVTNGVYWNGCNAIAIPLVSTTTGTIPNAALGSNEMDQFLNDLKRTQTRELSGGENITFQTGALPGTTLEYRPNH